MATYVRANVASRTPITVFNGASMPEHARTLVQIRLLVCVCVCVRACVRVCVCVCVSVSYTHLRAHET